MSERPTQPGPDPFRDDALDELSLPESVVSALKAGAGAAPEVPAYIDVSVMAAFDRQQVRGTSRRQVWRFAAVAACVALLVGIGSGHLFKTPKAAPDWKRSEVAGAVGLRQATAPPLALETLETRELSKPGSPGGVTGAPPKSSGDAMARAKVVLATIDADANGRVDVLDVLRVAKTIEAVRIARDLRDRGETDAYGEASRDAFWVASLDVTWDLTSDGSVDQRDIDLLAAQIVTVGAS